MKLTISKTVQEETEITLPAFYKKDEYGLTSFLVIFSEKSSSQITILSSGLTAIVHNCIPKNLAGIEELMETSEPCTEEEFMTAWESALQSLSFKATLIEKAEA